MSLKKKLKYLSEGQVGKNYLIKISFFFSIYMISLSIFNFYSFILRGI